MSLMSCRPPGFSLGGPHSTAQDWTSSRQDDQENVNPHRGFCARSSQSQLEKKQRRRPHPSCTPAIHSPLAYKDHLAYRAPWHRQKTLHAERVQPPAEEPLQTLKPSGHNVLAKETTHHIVTCKNIISLDTRLDRLMLKRL